MTHRPTNVEVIVVGAGVSGLAVADALTRSGRLVRVLEARPRPGGRLLSAPPALDLGATWFWDGEERVAAMARRFDLATFPQYLDGDTVFEDHRGVHRLDGNLIDVPSHRFVAGAASLTDALAAALPEGTVSYGCVAETITVDSDDRLVVATSDDTHAAEHVVLALPPSLAISTIAVPEQLPADVRRVAAATPVWMGQTVKVIAAYDEPFWRARGLAGAGVSHIGPLQEIHDMSGPDGRPAALFGFAPSVLFGPESEARVLTQLARLFGPEAARPQHVIIQNWSDEPRTVPPAVPGRPGPGTSRADYAYFGHAAYQRPSLEGRLHWASTETATTAPGHIEGALQAAERTARTILSSTPSRAR
ncbi:MAG: NAD(P)/FAD-dependent oxidoreductase [Ilumatobacteraceae bacterium]